MAEDFEHLSPYNYGMNNPILMIDPDGMSADTSKKTIDLRPIVITAPRLDPFTGFWGTLDYYLNNGNFGRYHYSIDGNPTKLAPIMGTPPDISRFGFSWKDLKGLIKVAKRFFRNTNNVSELINVGKQGKHLLGHNNYIAGRSILQADAQRLLDDFHKGEIISSDVIDAVKTRVDFGKIIGNYINPQTGTGIPTTKGIIISSKTGAHIVPARP